MLACDAFLASLMALQQLAIVTESESESERERERERER